MNAPTTATDFRRNLPFDADYLDQLLDEAGIDALVVSTRHNIQYLVGGDYRFFFFEHFDANGISRYLPLLVYARGKPEATAYIGNGMESYEKENGRFWMPSIEYAGTSLIAMNAAIAHLRRLGPETLRIGVERAFLPADAEELLRKEMPRAQIKDALFPLERLRMVKTERELSLLREASEKVVESMLAVMAGHGAGTSKYELTEALKREELNRGLTFEYCLLTAGTSLNRAPSPQRLNEGDIFSLDSGGNYHGYIGDLCRMAIVGEPDAELQDLLGAIEDVQQAARKPIRAGAIGREIYASAGEVLRRMPQANRVEFVAHGVGLVTHEAPRLTDTGPIPYPATDADKPLQAGMVLSIETTLPHPTRGFIKLEDTVAVTKDGWEAFGDGARGWNRAGTAIR